MSRRGTGGARRGAARRVLVGVAVVAAAVSGCSAPEPVAGPTTEPPPAPPGPTGTVFYRASSAGPGAEPTLYATRAGTPSRTVASLDGKSGAAVSPDGRNLAWVDIDGGSNRATLMVAAIDGTNPRALVDGANGHGLCNLPAWSPDSRRILVQEELPAPDAAGRWKAVDVTTGRAVALEPTGCNPVWSPDGSSIAWYDASAPAGASTIRITDETGRTSRFVPAVEGRTHSCGTAAVALSPGGRFAIVESPEAGARSCGDGPGPVLSAGIVIDTRTGDIVPVVPGPIGSGSFLADGRLVAHLVGRGEVGLFGADLRLEQVIGTTGRSDGVGVLAFVQDAR